MTTPTPGSKHPATSGLGATPVSTPFSTSRSVNLSPQAYRKSPAASHLYGHTSGTPIGALNFDSPTTAAALATMPLTNLSLDSSVGGGLGMGGMAGLHDMGVRLDEDERKRRRLAQVVDVLHGVKGRVSEEGIERLARRVGLECLWEDGIGGAGRTLVIAGTGFSIDIVFAAGQVETVAANFFDSPETVTRHADEVGRLLLDDLKAGMRSGLGDRNGIELFAKNLERMATMDKLSVAPQLNCYEAVVGIYESLKKLYDWEFAQAKEEPSVAGKSDAHIAKAVLCAKSGRAIMNAHGNVGLNLDYWQDRDAASRSEKTWSLSIECAPSSFLVYPSVRTSTNWISDSIRKSDPTPDDLLLANGLDWQDPPNILLPVDSKDENAMQGIEQSQPNQKLPDVRFVAKLMPPLVLPFNVAAHVLSSTNTHLPQEHGLATWDALVFPAQREESTEIDGAHRRIRREQEVTVYSGDGQSGKRVHANTLTVPKVEYAQMLTEIPFSHPRELVAILPTLRRYARLSALLAASFGDGTAEASEGDGAEPDDTVKDEFDAFMAEARHEEASDYAKLPVDVVLYTQPHPRLRIDFPIGKRRADAWVEVGDNGTLSILNQNIVGEDGDGAKLKAQDLGRILEIAGDIGVFVEFVRMKLQ